MRVAKDHVVVFDYALYDGDGDVVEETDDVGGEPVTCVWGYGALVPALRVDAANKSIIDAMAAGYCQKIGKAFADAMGIFK